jgi:Domain of unknown function (DUF4190)
MAELTAEPVAILAAPVPAPAAAELAEPWSIPAIAGAACGIFLIVPYLSGAAAIGLGIAGLRQTADRAMRGRRLAWGGIILGLLNVVGWTVYFWLIAELSAGGRTTAHQFFADLNSPNPQEARRDCLGVPPQRLDAAANELQNWGGLKSVTVLYITSDSSNGTVAGVVRGDLETPGGKHLFQLQTTGWKITNFSIQ